MLQLACWVPEAIRLRYSFIYQSGYAALSLLAAIAAPILLWNIVIAHVLPNIPSDGPSKPWQESVCILTGKWLTLPKRGADTPSLVVHCQPGQDSFGHTNGKFIDGYFVAGAVLDGHVDTSGSTVTVVQFRLDDRDSDGILAAQH